MIVPAKTPGPSPPEMPTEMWEHVFQYLEPKDIKAARLSWRNWVHIGWIVLFQRPFVFREDRNDVRRLNTVLSVFSATPILPTAIKSLRFEFGHMNLLHMTHSLAGIYRVRYNTQQPLEWDEQHRKSVETLQLDAAEEYASWNASFHASQNFEFASGPELRTSWPSLENLERIDFAYRSSPFLNNFLNEAWVEGSNYKQSNFQKANAEFRNIFEAIRQSKPPLKHLSHDQLPVSVFFPETNCRMGLLSFTTFASLRTLHLTFDASTAPHLKFWEKLGEFLQIAPKLKDLRFGIVPCWQKGRIQGKLWEFSKNPLEWYVPLWKIIGDYHWQELESLRLDGLVICEKGLADFLIRHAKSLRSLELFTIGLWHGSFRGLLTSLKVSLSLDNFRIWGTLRAFHTPCEAWRLRPTYNDISGWFSPEFAAFMEDITARYWDPTDTTFVSSEDVTLRLESFMKTSIAWPLKEEDVLKSIIDISSSDEALPHTDECCAMSMEDIDGHWEKGITKDLSDWLDWDTEDATGVGIELVARYDDNGFDEEGFNQHGFDIHGKAFQETYISVGRLIGSSRIENSETIIHYLLQLADVTQEIIHFQDDDGVETGRTGKLFRIASLYKEEVEAAEGG